MIFRVHCEAISKHEFDAFYFVPRGLETRRRCGDATLIAVPEMKMHADFGEALQAYLSIWSDAELLVILLQSSAQCQVRDVLAFGPEQSGFCPLHASLCGLHVRALG